MGFYFIHKDEAICTCKHYTQNKREEAKFQFRGEFTEQIRRNGFRGLVIDASIARHPIDPEKSCNIFIEETRSSDISIKALHRLAPRVCYNRCCRKYKRKKKRKRGGWAKFEVIEESRFMNCKIQIMKFSLLGFLLGSV